MIKYCAYCSNSLSGTAKEGSNWHKMSIKSENTNRYLPSFSFGIFADVMESQGEVHMYHELGTSKNKENRSWKVTKCPPSICMHPHAI